MDSYYLEALRWTFPALLALHHCGQPFHFQNHLKDQLRRVCNPAVNHSISKKPLKDKRILSAFNRFVQRKELSDELHRAAGL